jgi:hypothetical protein
MLKYKGMKTIDQIKKDAEAQGWETDFTDWDRNGSDWFLIEDMEHRMLRILVNCFGRFFVFKKDVEHWIATEKNEEFDDELWYREILDLINVPKEIEKVNLK